MIYRALSILSPAVENIINGSKKVEIRSWAPSIIPLKNLVLVENYHYLVNNQDIDDGYALAIVDIVNILPWTEDMFLAQNDETKLNKKWQPDYFVWIIENVRPLQRPIKCMALKGIYNIDLDISQP